MSHEKIQYDAVAVLGSGIVKDPETGAFDLTTYEHSGAFGMSGGHIRSLGAACLEADNRINQLVIFAGGPNRKKDQAFGPGNYPTSAAVHSAAYFRELGHMGVQPTSAVDIRETSRNTHGNLQEVSDVLQENPDITLVGILSSRYHIPRIVALCLRYYPDLVERAAFLPAEEIVMQYLPDRVDEIETAYSSPEANKRYKAEAQGLQDLMMGTYDPTEQLTLKKK